MRVAGTSMLLAVVMLTGACGGGNMTCDKPERYQASEPGQRIVAPDGLTELPAFEELKIPDASPRVPRPEGSPCLDRPPAYQSRK